MVRFTIKLGSCMLQVGVFESCKKNRRSKALDANASDDDDDHHQQHHHHHHHQEDESESSSYRENQTNMDAGVVHDHDHIHINDSSDDDDDHFHFHDHEGESSRDERVTSQIATDEAFARSLQEQGDEFDQFLLAEYNVGPGLNREDVGPDTMRYEELVNLTAPVGVETAGLSAMQISQLSVSIYTSRMFLNNIDERCAICQESFKIGKQIITLPCVHLYHKKCIMKWLKLKKNCPMCQTEVV